MRGTAEPAFDRRERGVGEGSRSAGALRVGCGKAEGKIKPLLEVLVADELTRRGGSSRSRGTAI